MHNIMLDLETMGTGPNAAICAIGAVAFDVEQRELGATLYMQLDLTDSVRCGGVIDPETVLWWLQQSDEARQKISGDGYPVATAVWEFTDFIQSLGGEDKVKIWGNGSDFDNVILSSMFRRLGLQAPWKFWNNRCYRTVKNLHPQVEMVFEGVRHDALSDAINQAQHLIAMLNPLEGVA